MSARELTAVGIRSIEQLVSLGWEAFVRPVRVYPNRRDLNMALALIGAVEDLDRRRIPADPRRQARSIVKELRTRR